MRNVVAMIGAPGNTEQTLNLIMQGGTVARYHNVDTIKVNTTAQHQWGVAMLCYMMSSHLAESARLRLVMAGLSHDVAEKAFGDVSAPTKRRIGRTIFDALEESFLFDNGLSFTLDAEQDSILKLADILDGMLYCTHERAMGNKFIECVYETYYGYATKEILLTARQREILDTVQAMWRSAIG